MSEESKPKKKIGFWSTIGIVSVVIVVVAVIMSITAGEQGNPVKKNPDNVSNNTQNPGGTSILAQTTKSGIEFRNVLLENQMGITNVIGEAVNNDNQAHSFTLKISFYDKDKKLLGSAVGAVNDLNGGETKIFNAMTTVDYTKSDSYKVDVDTIVTTTANRKSPVEFSNTVIKYQAGSTIIDGEAKNTDNREHSFTVVVAFYDSNNKLIGAATGAVNGLAAGDTKTFTAMATGDFTKAASHIVQIDTLVK